MATFTKTINMHNTNYHMDVVVKLNTTNHTYFSITYSIYRGNHMEMSGSCSDTIAKHFPELVDVLALHLSDSDGVPMHCLENGFFFCNERNESGSLEYTDLVVSEHFRIPLEDVADIRKMSKDDLASWVECQKPRWKEEAESMKVKYSL